MRRHDGTRDEVFQFLEDDDHGQVEGGEIPWRGDGD
jgi:hypothetical protein